MTTVNKSWKVKCPHCGGQGTILKKVSNAKEIGRIEEINRENLYELRLPNLTGTKNECSEALIIRFKFVQMAKRRYHSETYCVFIKLISYESHSIFWIRNKECTVEGLINKIAVKNPTAFELIDRMR